MSIANTLSEKNSFYEFGSDTKYFLLALVVIGLISLFSHIFNSFFSKNELFISLRKSLSKSFLTFLAWHSYECLILTKLFD